MKLVYAVLRRDDLSNGQSSAIILPMPISSCTPAEAVSAAEQLFGHNYRITFEFHCEDVLMPRATL